MPDDVRELLSLDALDERIAIVGTSGSSKTYAECRQMNFFQV
jgi:hypothetical protein